MTDLSEGCSVAPPLDSSPEQREQVLSSNTATHSPRNHASLLGVPPELAVVIPCYRVTKHVAAVIAAVPPAVSRIYCVDDGCPEKSGNYVEERTQDPRVRVLYHGANRGVGAAMCTGYRAALADGSDIIIKVDGDGQMDPQDIPKFVDPIVRGLADYTKGNRFFRLADLTSMPLVRLLGNTALSFVSKLSTGYWRLFDPNNGYTAVDSRVLGMLPLESLHEGYFFESDMLFRLNTVRAVVLDIPMKARYGTEVSNVDLPSTAIKFAWLHTANFFKRLFYNYFLRGFSVASVEWLLGPLLIIFGVVFGVTQWIEAAQAGNAATAGTVMLASLPTIVGTQMLLSAIHFDISSEPSIPLVQRLADKMPAPE